MLHKLKARLFDVKAPFLDGASKRFPATRGNPKARPKKKKKKKNLKIALRDRVAIVTGSHKII